MTGQWEKYAEQAAKAGHDAFFAIEQYDDQGELLPVKRRDVWREVAEAVLATVGPLVAEDTRERMVAAACEVVKREQSPFYYCPTSGEIEQTYEGGFSICCEAPKRHEPITSAAMKAAQKMPPL